MVVVPVTPYDRSGQPDYFQKNILFIYDIKNFGGNHMLDYNVWQNDFNRYSCTRIHKKFYAFKKATRPFFTGRSCKNRIDGMSRSFVQKCMNKGLHMNPINKF